MVIMPNVRRINTSKLWLYREGNNAVIETVIFIKFLQQLLAIKKRLN